jgi:hypothetical protein
MGRLPHDSDRNAVQVFTPNVRFAPFALAASTKVLRLRGELGVGELDCREARVLTVTPSTTALTRHFDSATTVTHTLAAGASNVFGVPPLVSTCTITGTDAAIEIEGM